MLGEGARGGATLSRPSTVHSAPTELTVRARSSLTRLCPSPQPTRDFLHLLPSPPRGLAFGGLPSPFTLGCLGSPRDLQGAEYGTPELSSCWREECASSFFAVLSFFSP